MVSLIVKCKFTVFALFLSLRAIFQAQAPKGLVFGGDLTEVFLHYHFWGLIFGGAYVQNFLFFFFEVACFSQVKISAQAMPRLVSFGAELQFSNYEHSLLIHMGVPLPLGLYIVNLKS